MGKEPFILMDMRYNDAVYENKLNIASNYMRGITSLFADPFKNFKNFSTLAKAKNGDMLRHLSNVDMSYGKAGLVPNSFLVADTFSSKLGIRIDNGKPYRERINARRFDLSTGGYLTIRNQKQEHGNSLGHFCPIDRGNTLDDLPIEFDGNLYPAFRVHDAHANFDFVEQARERMNAGTLLSFLHAKKYGRQVLDAVYRYGQTSLKI